MEPGLDDDVSGWEEATFEGHARAQRARAAALPPLVRLAMVERAVRDAHRAGLLVVWRERRQREVMAAWEAARGAPPAV